MTDAPTHLEPPLLLLATPQVMDPFFHKSVVLLVSHGEEGSAGFIVNRTTEGRVSEVLKGMGIPWKGPEAAPIYFGGPVQPHLGTMLFDTKDAVRPMPDSEPSPPASFLGIQVSQDAHRLARIALDPPPSFKLMLGYAGWGAGQLLQEIIRNDWLLAPLDKRLLFTPQPDEAWVKAVRSLGLDPSSLSSWVTGSGGGVN